MIGKILGAMVGDKIANRMGHDGATGALLGAAAAAFVRRSGPVGLALVGGVAAANYLRKKKRERDVTPRA